MDTNDKCLFLLDHLPISVSFCCLEGGSGSVVHSTQVVRILEDGVVITSSRKIESWQLAISQIARAAGSFWWAFLGESAHGRSYRSRAIAQRWGTQIQNPDRNCRAVCLENKPGNGGAPKSKNPKTGLNRLQGINTAKQRCAAIASRRRGVGRVA